MTVTLARLLELTEREPVAGVTRPALRGLVACLDVETLADGLVELFEADPRLCLMFQKQLLHLRKIGRARTFPSTLARRLLAYETDSKPIRRRLEAATLALYPGFRPRQRREILQALWDDGARTAFTTAARHERVVFPHAALLQDWLAGDVDAARELAWSARPAQLTDLLPQLLAAPGWIVRMAAARAGRVSAVTWLQLRRQLPGTYTYLCLRRGRTLSDAKAWRLVEAAYAHVDPEESDIAVWALGELGRAALLERVSCEALQLAARRPAEVEARRPFRRWSARS